MPTFSVQPNDKVTFKVLFEDDALVVVNKPPGTVTQPGLAHEDDSLLNGLFARFGPALQNLGQSRDFGLLHRLDRATSGLLIVALRADSYDHLRAQFENHTIKKFYWAVVKGAPKEPKGVLRMPIAEDHTRDLSHRPTGKPRLARISRAGKPAITAYRVLETSRVASLVECRLLTGRLHQIRVHLDAIGCPVLGDDLYAPPGVRDAAPRLALHSHRVVVDHPLTGATVDVHSPWPGDLKGLLKKLGLTKPTANPLAP
ncbi:MAG: RluA family pseudouridine synthase [Phycisphaerales bacterium]|nr:RluA family pseudouridine synthase [Phycisphaerales bacterium]